MVRRGPEGRKLPRADELEASSYKVSAFMTWTGPDHLAYPLARVSPTTAKRGPRMRLTKLADRESASPGDVLSFVIAYENITLVSYKSVTIVDSLPAELVYVEGSANSSRDARITVESNEVGSARLKWRIEETIEPGEGGLVTFRATVKTRSLPPED